MTKKILITGANGQLGHEMRNALKGNNRFECIFTDVAELDICNTEAVKQTMANNHIDYIVNCAAYTQVDKAEDLSLIHISEPTRQAEISYAVFCLKKKKKKKTNTA